VEEVALPAVPVIAEGASQTGLGTSQEVEAGYFLFIK